MTPSEVAARDAAECASADVCTVCDRPRGHGAGQCSRYHLLSVYNALIAAARATVGWGSSATDAAFKAWCAADRDCYDKHRVDWRADAMRDREDARRFRMVAPILAGLVEPTAGMTAGPWRACSAAHDGGAAMCVCGLVWSEAADMPVASVMLHHGRTGGESVDNRADGPGIAALRNALPALMAAAEGVE